MPSRPRLIVVYDVGAAGPLEIAQSLSSGFDCTFAVSAKLIDTASTGILSAFGPVRLLSELLQGAPKVDGVVTFSEKYLAESGQLAMRVGVRANSARCTSALMNKSRQRSMLSEQGIAPVVFRTFGSVADLDTPLLPADPPYIIKPVIGTGSQDVFEVATATECHALLRDMLLLGRGPLLVEEKLTGISNPSFSDYVSVETVTLDSQHLWSRVTGKFPLVPPFRESGAYWPSGQSPDVEAQLIALAQTTLTSLDVTQGVTHTEIKLTPAGPRIIEVNGRLGGLHNDLIRTAEGGDLIVAAAMVSCGLLPSLEPSPPTNCVFFWNNLAPLEATSLLNAVGERQVRSSYGVQRYNRFRRPGALSGGVATVELDHLVGTAPHLSQLPQTIEDAIKHLEYAFTIGPDQQTVNLSALEMPAWRALQLWKSAGSADG